MPRWIRISSLLAGLAVCGCSGCGKPTGTVSGTVAYQGKRLAMGTVTLINEGSKAWQADIQADGTFEIDAVVYGSYQALVFCPEPTMPHVNSSKKRTPADIEQRQKDSEAVLARWFEIPKRYSELGQSDLRVQVDRDLTACELQLKD